jgi:hypothetical protein
VTVIVVHEFSAFVVQIVDKKVVAGRLDADVAVSVTIIPLWALFAVKVRDVERPDPEPTLVIGPTVAAVVGVDPTSDSVNSVGTADDSVTAPVKA